MRVTKEPSCGGLKGWGRAFTLMPFWGERRNGECVGNGYGEEVFGVNMIFLGRSRKGNRSGERKKIWFFVYGFWW